MTKRVRRNHSRIQGKVALAALKGEKTLVELAQQFNVHVQPNHAMESTAFAGLPSIWVRGKAGSMGPTVD